MPIRARLQVILKADDTVVARSGDPQLWKEAFDAILERESAAPLPPAGPAPERSASSSSSSSNRKAERKGAERKGAERKGAERKGAERKAEDAAQKSSPGSARSPARSGPVAGRSPQHATQHEEHPGDRTGKDREDAVKTFADRIGVAAREVESACRPSTTAPFLRLDRKRWRAMKDALPARGPNALSSIITASTLLTLWAETVPSLGPATVDRAQAVLDTIGQRDKNPSRGLRNCSWLRLETDGAIHLRDSRWRAATAVARAYCLGRAPEMPDDSG